MTDDFQICKEDWKGNIPNMRKTVSTQKLLETEIYYGTTYFSGEPICFDRRNIMYPNGILFGQAGTGKQWAAIHEIQQVIQNTNDDIIILDVDGYYARDERISEAVTQVNPFDLFDEKSEYHINPLDIYIGNDTFCNREDIIPYDAALAMFEEIIGRPLAPYECAAVERACDAVFEPFTERLKAEGKCCDYANNPTLKDVADVLIALPKPSELRLIVALKETIQRETDNENKELSSRVTDCIDSTFCYSAVGGLIDEINKIYLYIDRYFSYKTNMPDDRVIQLAWWRNLPHRFAKAAYTACLHYAWNRLVQHRDTMSNAKEYKYLWIYLENADTAFRSVTKGLTNSLMNLYRRSRPYGGIVTLIAQDYTDILSSDEGRACIVNTEFIRFLSMNPTDRENIRRMYNLSDNMIESIHDVPCGHGLLYINSNWIPFELRKPRKQNYSIRKGTF